MLARGILIGMREGAVAIPAVLLKHYGKLKLNEIEVMLIIQLIAFKEHEHNDFPTIEELQARMPDAGMKLIDALQKLLKRKLISIDESFDDASGIQYEKYNLDELFMQLALLAAAEQSEIHFKTENVKTVGEEKNLFNIFEKEFARPLSPMECETISGWLDQDRYPTELILFALKEAVFSGKLHFRYIDRILLEWSRNRIFNVEQAKEYSRKFRGERL